jgi:hypothetical protein
MEYFKYIKVPVDKLSYTLTKLGEYGFRWGDDFISYPIKDYYDISTNRDYGWMIPVLNIQIYKDSKFVSLTTDAIIEGNKKTLNLNPTIYEFEELEKLLLTYSKSINISSSVLDRFIMWNKIKDIQNHNKSQSNQYLNVEKWLTISNIKSKIFTLQVIGNVDDLLDYIFDIIDNLFIEKKFELVNTLFESIDVNLLTIDSIVGILTITHNCKDKLPFRSSFYKQAYKILNDQYPSEEVNQILGGLD